MCVWLCVVCCDVLRSSSSSSRLLRRDRSRRSKRERGGSPARLSSPVNQMGRSSRSTSTRLSAVNHMGRGSRSLADTSQGSETVRHSARGRSCPVHKAVSPAVALCMRAVYAAFLWHEGVVHDAMACASFLKFHPTLPKDLPAQWRTTASTEAGLSTDDDLWVWMSLSVLNSRKYGNYCCIDTWDTCLVMSDVCSVPSYQISAESHSAWLSYWWFYRFSWPFFMGAASSQMVIRVA